MSYFLIKYGLDWGGTYEIYLIHFLLGVVFHKAIKWLGFDWNIYLFFVYVAFVTLIALGFKWVCQKISSRFVSERGISLAGRMK